MSLIKYTNVEEILETKSSNERLDTWLNDPETLSKFASLKEKYDPSDDYLYVRCRAISSRTNRNGDSWPSEELAASYKTFEGKPIFVDHNNSDPKRTRGVIVSSTLHVDNDKTSSKDSYYSSADVDPIHLPPTWIELVLEIDAKTFPKLATEIREGRIDSVSMGANIDISECNICGHESESPSEYCSHLKNKGVTFEIESSDGKKIRKKSDEICRGVKFFEISEVFNPADETALHSERLGKTSALDPESLIEPFNADSDDKDDRNYIPQDDKVTAPQKVDTLRDETLCPNCHSGHLQTDPDGIQKCSTCGYVSQPEPLNNPDLSTARDVDLRQQDNQATDSQGNEEVPVSDNDTDGITIVPTSSYIFSDSDRRINEMDWKITLETTSKAMADKVLPAKASSINIRLAASDGIGFGTHLAFKEEGINAQVRYPVDGDNINTLPGNPLKDFALLNRSMAAIGTNDPAKVMVRVTSDNLERAVELIGGDLNKTSTQKAKKKVLLPSTHKATSEPKDQKIISDQLAPITAKLAELRDRLAEVTVTVKDDVKVEPEAPVAEVETPEVETETPEVEAKEESKEETKESSENKLLTIFSLADELVELGVITRESKMIFVAELENESDEAIEGRIRMLAGVKEAGLKKTARVATAGITRVPRLSHVMPSSNGTGSHDSIPDEAIFI